MNIQATTKAIRDGIARLSNLPSAPKLAGCSVIQIDADEFGSLGIKRATTDSTARTVVDAVINIGGTCAIDLGFFREKIKDMDGILEINTDAKHMHLKCGNASAKIMLLAGEEFIMRDLDDPEALRHTTVSFKSPKIAKSLFGSALKFSYVGEGRAQLVGAALRSYNGGLKLYGTDGRRMGIMHLGDRFGPVSPDAVDDGILIAPECVASFDTALGELKGELSIHIGERSFSAKCENTWVRYRMSAARPQNITAYLIEPTYDIDITFDRINVSNAVQRATGLNNGAYITLDQMGAVISGRDGIGNEFREDVAMSGTPCTLYFNGCYFREMLSTLEGDEVRLLGNSKTNMLFISRPDRLLYLAMMRE